MEEAFGVIGIEVVGANRIRPAKSDIAPDWANAIRPYFLTWLGECYSLLLIRFLFCSFVPIIS